MINYSTYKNYRINIEKLQQPYCNLIYLLDNGFRKNIALKFVSNHYLLSSLERNILQRVAFSKDKCIDIKKRRIDNPSIIKQHTLWIDFYNQIYSIKAIINNQPLFIGRDGFLRDIYRSIDRGKPVLDQSTINFFVNGLKSLNPKEIHLVIDSQISHSKKHAKLVDKELPSCQFHLLKAVDYFLKKIGDKGIVLTHDSIIILKNKKCFDFPQWFLNQTITKLGDLYPIVDFRKIECGFNAAIS